MWTHLLKRLPLIAAVCLLLSTAPKVQAHGYIVRAIPSDRAVLDLPPTRVQYWFSEPLEPDFSSLRVVDAAGNLIAEGGVPPENRALLTARLPNSLPQGAYRVDLRLAFASDGHVIVERRFFFVGSASATDDTAATNSAVALEVAWRVPLIGGLLLLFGISTLYAVVLLPAWGSRDHRAGGLPPRVMRRLHMVAIGALVLAFAANLLALWQQTLVFFASPPTLDLLNIVRTGTRYGDVWNVRVLALLLAGALLAGSLYTQRRRPDFVQRFWLALPWAAALALGTISASSHAAGSLLLPWAALTVDWLHTLGAGGWTGGVMALALVVPAALAPYQGEARRQALLVVLKRFSRLAVAAVAVVIASGMYSASNWIFTPQELASTDYGQTLLLKVLMVTLLLSVALVHHAAVYPARFQAFSTTVARLPRLLGWTLPLEVVIVAAVLVAVGLLSATPVPTPPFVAEQLPSPTGETQAGDRTVRLTVLPGGPGINTYDVQITQAGTPVDNASVYVRWVHPERDQRSGWLIAEPVEQGSYALAGAELLRPGLWWALLEIDGQRAAFAFDIRTEASVLVKRSPEPVHLVLLALVAGTVFYALLPVLRSALHALHLGITTVTITTLALLGLAAVLFLTAWASENSTQLREEQLNPLPGVINTVLPDAASLERGAQLYRDSCIEWQSAPTFRGVRGDLATIRDEDLFHATRDGWQGLPACTGDLTDAQRWDIVNYFRTFER